MSFATSLNIMETAASPSSYHSGKSTKIKYTDVVVIGNGPSGITLSYMLSGYWPYYTGAPHTNEYLQLRLEDGGGKSLIEQDLDFLSNGLEGRSSNPVGLLFDAMTHPDADMGMEHESLLNWKNLPEKAIPHVVLGRKKPGGAWQMIDGQMQTLSLGNWMQLPDLPFKDWLIRYKATKQRNSSTFIKPDRASIEEVRLYYEDYVKVKGLEENFHTSTTVTSVERVLDVSHSVDSESGEQNPCSYSHHGKFKWEVRGYEMTTDDEGIPELTDFCYRAPNIVLATGSYDLPNRLRVPGECYSYVKYMAKDLERKLQDGTLNKDSDPVVIVGAGLSAADAILCCMEYGIPVVHLFRRDVEDPSIIFKKLPAKLYPEYHKVLRMMKSGDELDGYKSYPQHSVVEFKEDKKVLIKHHRVSSCNSIIQASFVLIQIGSRPDLSFMPQSGRNLGVVPGMQIDSKHNPIDIDPYAYQSLAEPGLFAMGPLAGDNFVRFLRGGAMGITAHLWRKQNNEL
jgi:thioredoxin reductase